MLVVRKRSKDARQSIQSDNHHSMLTSSSSVATIVVFTIRPLLMLLVTPLILSMVVVPLPTALLFHVVFMLGWLLSMERGLKR